MPGGDIATCQKMFADFARTTRDSPLYSSLAEGIAVDPSLSGLLRFAPPAQRVPVLLFAAVHWLLLGDADEPLARHYPNLRQASSPGAAPPADDPVAALGELCRRRGSEIAELLSTRRTQTNEIGRTALFVPVMGLLASARGPLVHLDVGASAGLNLLIPHYDFAFEPGGTISTGSTVTIRCGTRGAVPVPSTHPPIVAAIGLDPNPLDVSDPDQARWLEACVWPDQTDRFERLSAAIGIANRVSVDVRRGDAVSGIAALITEAAPRGHPVLTTSWVMNYLSAQERLDFVGVLDEAARRTDISWISAENPALCPELPGAPPPSEDRSQPTALVLVSWRSGRRSSVHLADAHPHGRWMRWR